MAFWQSKETRARNKAYRLEKKKLKYADKADRRSARGERVETRKYYGVEKVSARATGKSKKIRARAEKIKQRKSAKKVRQRQKTARVESRTDRTGIRKRQKTKRTGLRTDVRKTRVKQKGKSGYWSVDAIKSRQSEMWGGISSLGQSAASAYGASQGKGLIPSGTETRPTTTGDGLPDWAIPVGVGAVLLVVLATTSKKKAA